VLVDAISYVEEAARSCCIDAEDRAVTATSSPATSRKPPRPRVCPRPRASAWARTGAAAGCDAKAAKSRGRARRYLDRLNTGRAGSPARPSACGDRCVGWSHPNSPTEGCRTKGGSRSAKRPPNSSSRDNTATVKPLRLSGGEKNVVRSSTPSPSPACHRELCSLRDNLPQFTTVTPSSSRSQRLHPHPARLREQEGLEYPLLSDFWPARQHFARVRRLRRGQGLRRARNLHHRQGGRRAWTVVNALPDARDLNEYVKALNTRL